MNRPVKLLLDECLGHPLATHFSNALAHENPPPIIHHLFNYFQSGETDDVWIPKIADGRWIILTADRGKKGRVKLPNICVAYKVTHILMSAAVMKMKQKEKAEGVLSLWKDIKNCDKAPRGSRFRTEAPSGKFALKQIFRL